MALRMTEEEYKELMRTRLARAAENALRQEKQRALESERTYTANRLGYGAIAGAVPEKEKRRSKYGNRRVEVDGKKFDSAKEARVYMELMTRVRAGELKCVCRQVSFDLPGGIRYVADFVTIRPDMSIEGVYDVKSEATKKNRVYINKKKQMAACWGIEIREV